jgi:hypothetical protein
MDHMGRRVGMQRFLPHCLNTAPVWRFGRTAVAETMMIRDNLNESEYAA